MRKMSKLFTRVCAFAFAAAILAGSGMTVHAAEDRSYTYNYDYWGDVQDCPDFYTVVNVFTSADLNLEVPLKGPSGLYVNGNRVYICDTLNNRIVVCERTSIETLEVVDIISEIKGDVEIKELNGPTDIAISEDGNIFIADKGNFRIVKVDKDLNYLMEFSKPNDSALDEKLQFMPNKIVCDTAERIYCIADGINKGLVKYENDGTFSGFVGATPATFDFKVYIQKKLATQAQRDRMESFVPTEYDNIYMDYEGFIFACTGHAKEEDLKNDKADAVRRLNLLGNNILVKNGEYPPYGDLYMGSGGGYVGPSYFADVTSFENDVYVCLDRNRGRLFGYNDQGQLMYAFGGNGHMDGYFRRPVGLDHMGYDLFVLDSLDCSVTLFTLTEFGQSVYDAMEYFDDGNYEESAKAWKRAMVLDGNYDLSYIGIGRAYLREEEYKEAMEYFELKYDDENYSKAYKEYRKEWVEENIVPIVIVLLVLFLVPATIRKVKDIKHEIDIADIFRI